MNEPKITLIGGEEPLPENVCPFMSTVTAVPEMVQGSLGQTRLVGWKRFLHAWPCVKNNCELWYNYGDSDNGHCAAGRWEPLNDNLLLARSRKLTEVENG